MTIFRKNILLKISKLKVFLTALLGTKYITLITYKYNKHAVPKRENSERAIIAHARLPPDLTSVDIYKFT
jgi:hypothetical protein